MSEKKDNTLLVGFPSNGLISTFTSSYLIQTLKMKQIGEIDIPELPPTLFIENGEIFGPIRIYQKENLFVIMSDTPFPFNLAYVFAESVIHVVKKHKIDKVLIVSGLEPNNIKNINPKVYGIVTHNSLDNLLYENDIPKFLSGTIFGTDAAVISTLRGANIPTVMLYTECHPLFPDQKAAILAISILSKILKVQIDEKDVTKKLEFLHIQYRKLMQQTIDVLQQNQGMPPKRKTPQIYK